MQRRNAIHFLTLSLPVSIMRTCSVVITLESVDETLEMYSVTIQNETSSAVLLRDAICFPIFFTVKFGIFLKG